MINDSRERSNSKSSEIKILSWNFYLQSIDLLIDKIKKSKKKFDYVYGIPRGGLIPATIISHQLEIPMIDSYNLDTMYLFEKNILLLDDIIDTSKTIKELKETYNELNLIVATIYKHKNSPIIPDFYVYENDCWISFPYEKNINN